MAQAKFSAVFGQVVRHRLARDLSQERLAEDAEIHRTHVGLLERGLRSASLDIAERVARALGVPLSTLIAETEREWGRKGVGSASRRRDWSVGGGAPSTVAVYGSPGNRPAYGK